MLTMRTRRSFSRNHRLQALSLPTLVKGLEAVEHHWKYTEPRPKRWRVGPLLNAIVAHFLSLSEEEQDEILARSFVEVERLIELEGERPENSEGEGNPKPGTIDTKVIGPSRKKGTRDAV